MMRPEQVQIARFPIGHLLKPELRDLARELNLKTADKKDSQGICFIGEVKMEDFLRTFVADKPGKIVNLEGKVLGEHKGLHLYTLGQRKGIGVASPLHKQAYQVYRKVVRLSLPNKEEGRSRLSIVMDELQRVVLGKGPARSKRAKPVGI